MGDVGDEIGQELGLDPVGDGEGVDGETALPRESDVPTDTGGGTTDTTDTGTPGGGGCGESFAPSTLVATPHGQQTIGSLVVGAQVVAYNPTTGKTSTQTVQHVFIDHDSDLLDVTLLATPTRGPPPTTAKGQHDRTQATQTAPATDETVHTTANHPWLTADRGFARAGTLHLGEQVVRADGTTATVVGLRVVSGAANMWDLTVANLHTFAVGLGAYVVHNCGATADGVGGAGSQAGKPSDSAQFPTGQVQHAWKHAPDFGIQGNYNPSKGQQFIDAIKSIIDGPNTQAISGTYRGNIGVTHYYDPDTGLNVMIRQDDNTFISGWRLSPAQTENLFRSGNIQ